MGNAESHQELLTTDTHPQDISPFCSASVKIKTSGMVEAFNTLINNPLKKLVYDIACPTGTEHKGHLQFTRWKAIPVVNKFPPNQKCTLKSQQDVFSYTESENKNDIEWYVNFADTHLFVAHGGPLFAQDEMQVAEHPSLGHLKEYLKSNSAENPNLKPLTRDQFFPTPILIAGIERRCKVATDRNPNRGRPFGLYGNQFQRASRDAIRRATEVINPPTTTNLICMAALGNGRGPYKLEQVVDMFTTAYTSFFAAKHESLRIAKEKSIESPNVIVHTGNWGTGAFGGDRELMAALQLAAAEYAGIDELVYHTFDDAGTRGYNKGLAFYNELKETENQSFQQGFINKIMERKFYWGQGDGN